MTNLNKLNIFETFTSVCNSVPLKWQNSWSRVLIEFTRSSSHRALCSWVKYGHFALQRVESKYNVLHYLFLRFENSIVSTLNRFSWSSCIFGQRQSSSQYSPLYFVFTTSLKIGRCLIGPSLGRSKVFSCQKWRITAWYLHRTFGLIWGSSLYLDLQLLAGILLKIQVKIQDIISARRSRTKKW